MPSASTRTRSRGSLKLAAPWFAPPQIQRQVVVVALWQVASQRRVLPRELVCQIMVIGFVPLVVKDMASCRECQGFFLHSYAQVLHSFFRGGKAWHDVSRKCFT